METPLTRQNGFSERVIRDQTESVSGIDFSLFRINNLQNLLF